MNHEFAGGVTRIVYHVSPVHRDPDVDLAGLRLQRRQDLVLERLEPEPSRTGSTRRRSTTTSPAPPRSSTQGGAKMDVAVYMRQYSDPSAFSTPDGEQPPLAGPRPAAAGYTWDYLDESSFALPNAVVTDNRLAANGPNYKALIFDQFLYGTYNTARGSLTLAAANAILGYAQAGLPVIFVGSPIGTASLTEADATLAPIVTQILAQPTVHQVATEADVPAKLATPRHPARGQARRPDDAPQRPPPGRRDRYRLLLAVQPGRRRVPGLQRRRRRSARTRRTSTRSRPPAATRGSDAGQNPCMATGAAVDTLVTLEGQGTPYTLDPITRHDHPDRPVHQRRRAT